MRSLVEMKMRKLTLQSVEPAERDDNMERINYRSAGISIKSASKEAINTRKTGKFP